MLEFYIQDKVCIFEVHDNVKFMLVKFIMYNFFFHSYQLCGCGILSFGIYVQIEKGDYAAVTTTRGLTAALLLIVAGLITAVISFMGCLGAYKKMRTLLWIVSEESYYVDQ